MKEAILQTRTFHLGTILSITTGCLLVPNDGTYEYPFAGVKDILRFIEGNAPYTHETISASDRCAAVLLKQMPWLAEITPPMPFASEASVYAWLDTVTAKYGAEHAVKPSHLDRTMPPEETLRMALNEAGNPATIMKLRI